VVWLVTGFTLGHSATLTLGVLGILKPDVPVVEALIGFTIALVAAENVTARATAARLPVAFGAAAALCALAALRSATGIGLPTRTSLGLAVFALAYLPLASNADQALRLSRCSPCSSASYTASASPASFSMSGSPPAASPAP
jgi:hypothetical protein